MISSHRLLAPLPIGFSVFVVHLATIPITGAGINPARSFGPALLHNDQQTWNEKWIFCVGPFVGAAIAAAYQEFILRAMVRKVFEFDGAQISKVLGLHLSDFSKLSIPYFIS